MPSNHVIIYEHTLTNTGGVTDTYQLKASNDRGWHVELVNPDWPNGTLSLELVDVGPQASHAFVVSVTVPTDATDVTAHTTLTATSCLDPSILASATDIITVTTPIMPPSGHQIFLPLVTRNHDG